MNVIDALCRRYRDDDPRALILRLCRELLAESDSTVPTSLEDMAKLRGILLIEREDLGPDTRMGQLALDQHPRGLSAALVNHHGAFKVVLDIGDPPERQRFSLAHEIVHTFFIDVASETDELPDEPRLEGLCDDGAAELMMPANQFAKDLSGAPLSLGHLRHLAARYQATLYATGRRAMDLTDRRAAVWIVERSRPGQTAAAGDPILITRCYRSVSWPEVAILEGSPVPPTWVAARAMNGGLELSGTDTIPALGNVSVEAVGYQLQGGHLHGHARAIALVRSV